MEPLTIEQKLKFFKLRSEMLEIQTQVLNLRDLMVKRQDIFNKYYEELTKNCNGFILDNDLNWIEDKK